MQHWDFLGCRRRSKELPAMSGDIQGAPAFYLHIRAIKKLIILTLHAHT